MPLLPLLAPAFCLFALQVQDDVRNLLEKLHSERVEERDSATRKLRDLGKTAIPDLETAARSEDAETSARAKLVLRAIELRATLGRSLLQALPDLDLRLASNNPGEWTKVFLALLESNDQGRSKYPEVSRSDLAPLALMALRGAKTSGELNALCRVIGERGYRAAAPELIKLLRHEDDNVRWEAITALAQVDAREAAPDLLPLLKDSSTRVRGHAADILGLWRIREATPGLIEMLGDFDDGNRVSASRALCDLRAKGSVPAILELLTSGSRDARMGAMFVLGAMQAKEATPKVIPLLKDSDDSLRLRAVETLGRLGGKEAIPHLLPFLDDASAECRAQTAEALGNLGALEAAPKLVQLLRDKELPRKGLVVLGLAAMKARPSIPELRKLLRDEESDTRASAAGTLGFLEAKEALPDLFQLLEKDPEPEVRKEVISALGQIGARESVLPLTKLLDTPEYRDAVMEALDELGAKETAPLIAGYLRKGDEDSRRTAVEVLGSFGYEPAIPDITSLLDHPESGLRKEAATALGRLKATTAIPALEKLLDDPERNVRSAAATALCLLGSRKGVPILLENVEGVRQLNALRHPEVWKALAAKPAAEWPKNGLLDPKTITAAAGLPLDYSADHEAQEESWNFAPWDASVPRSAIGILEGVRSEDYELILEVDRIRVLPAAAALEFWRAWWAGSAEKK